MAETIEDITIHYEEEDQVLRRELAKEVLTKGAWTTIMFLYQDFDRRKEEFGPQKISIRRYQKRDGAYQQRSKFEISSPLQARAICAKIQDWLPPEE